MHYSWKVCGKVVHFLYMGANWYKIKIRKSDKIFSEYLRKKYGRCMYRFKCYGQPCDYKLLQVSHWQKRRAEGTRFDEQNCDVSCPKCHYYVENSVEGMQALEDFKLEQLGQQAYNLVKLRAQSYCKKDEIMAVLRCKALLNSLDQ